MLKLFRALYVIAFICFTAQSFSQQVPKTWEKFRPLIGEWTGEGGGKPGQGNGSFTFKTDLGGKILVRKNHSEYPASKDSPAGVHDDLMIIYPDLLGDPNKAIYFDNEGHTINYSVVVLPDEIVFSSVFVANLPEYRLTYKFLERNVVSMKFEMALPGNKEGFKTYVEGRCRRVK